VSQLHEALESYATRFPDPSSPTGVTNTVFSLGGNSNLQPEKSRAFTAGFDLKSPDLPNFQLSASYFHIDFDNRIQTPPLVGENLFTNVLTPFVIRNPSLALVESYFNSPNFIGDFTFQGPGAIAAIFNDQIANIATTKESGVDLNAGYRIPTAMGEFGIVLDVTHLIRNDFQAVNGSSPFALLNDFGQPPKWKGRAGLTWTRGPFIASAFGNYVNAYDNSLFTPAQSIGAWATGDLYFALKTAHRWPSPALRNLTVALNVNNVTDKRPPYVQIPAADLNPGQNAIPFDPANASPVGRLIAIQVTKAWGGSLKP
jgi:iron complex outermembrane receptor protein